MKFFTTAIIALTTSVTRGFIPSSTKPVTKTFNFNGDIAPTGYFDPLHLTDNTSEETLKYLREAELHHGRIAMISSLILPALDYVNKDELAINVLSKSNEQVNQACLFYMLIYEYARMVKLYKSPKDKLFSLKDNVQPGYLNTYVPFNEDKANKELSNGRLAMLGVLGYMVQELFTQQKVLF